MDNFILLADIQELPMMRMASGRQPLVNLTRSFHKQLLVQWTRSSYSKIYRITFSPMDQKWSYFYSCFYKNSIRDRSYCSATFGRGVSDEAKLCYADDMGVWFLGLYVCNFRRILLIHFVCNISRCLRFGGSE